MKRTLAALLLIGAAILVGGEKASAQAQNYPYYTGYQLNRFSYYPYYYFPHNYWPAMGPRYPEAQGTPYMKPPAYMAYPPFRERNWRYEMWQPQRFYRGSHFWLDQF